MIPIIPSVVPYTDFTSEILCEVIAIAILPLSIPSKIKDSFGIKLPSVSYRVKAELLVTDAAINAVAPLFAPFTKVGVAKVIGAFKVTNVYVCMSYKEIFHSFVLEFVALYVPDSNLKS